HVADPGPAGDQLQGVDPGRGDRAAHPQRGPLPPKAAVRALRRFHPGGTVLDRRPMKVRPLAGALFVVLVGCNEAPLKPPPADAGSPISGLPADQAARTVAKVGDRTLTLADFARTIERMDQFDRLRYQSKERRRELLEELIDIELLAAEAKRL